MIILKDECKKRGFTVGEFLEQCPVPAQTIRDWCKIKPAVVFYMLRVLSQKIEISVLCRRNRDLHAEVEFLKAHGSESEAQPDTTNND